MAAPAQLVAAQSGSTSSGSKKSSVPNQAVATQAAANPIQSAVDAYFRGDYTAAFPQWRRIADQGNVCAQAWVAAMFDSGQGTRKDAVAAAKYDRLAAEQGHTEAMWRLAVDLRTGNGVDKDEAAALKWDKASEGVRSAKSQRDCAEVAPFIRRAAEQGKPAAEKELAGMHFSGRGIPKSENEYEKWIQRAADHGDPDSMASVSFAYEYGKYGRAKDQTQAVAWLRKAADAGNNEAQQKLAWWYEDGNGIPKDYAQAEYWFLKAAEDPKTASAVKFLLSSLYFRIALAYESGDGVRKDPAEAAKWYRKSLESGYGRSAARLAEMYESGEGVPKDYAEAEKLYQKYAEILRAEAEEKSPNGARAAYDLAEFLDKGPVRPFLSMVTVSDDGQKRKQIRTPPVTVPKDHGQAVKLYMSAAEQGVKSSWRVVGGLYERGDGVPADLVRAYFWYNLSAAGIASDAKSAGDRDRVEKILTPDQVAEAQALSRKWREEHDGPSAGMRPPTPNPVSAGVPAAGGIRSEINQVAQGKYTPLPAAAHCVPYSGTGTLRTIENGTSYQLRVMFSGAVEREATIPPGQKQSIDLPVGAYKVVGRVGAANVLPFYGQESYKAGEECAVQFYVQ